MKAAIFIALFTVAAASGSLFREDGRPGCRTVMELTRPWRNHIDPTKFWLCTKLSTPALEMICDPGTAFAETPLACVPWEDWHWVTPKLPPSFA